MTKKGIEGFLSNPFFAALKPEDLDSKYVESVFSMALKREYNDSVDYWYSRLLQRYSRLNNLPSYYDFEDEYRVLVNLAVVELLRQEDVLKYFCQDDEYEKLLGILDRNQTNSKIFKLVSSRIAEVFSKLRYSEESLSLALNSDIKRKINLYDEHHIMEVLGSLKRVIDKIASGVKNECYLDFERRRYGARPSEELLNYIKEKHGYDFSKEDMHISYMFPKNNSIIISLAVVNDESIWQLEYPSKSIIEFVALVENYNDIKHAEKIIDYAFAEVCKNEKLKRLYDEKLPLYLADNLEDKMANYCAGIFNSKFGSLFNFKLSNEEIKGFVYPVYDGFDNQIIEGERVFNDFINAAYKSEANKIFELMNDMENVVQDSEKVTRSITRRRLTLHQYFEFELLGYDDIEEKEKYLAIFCKDYESTESIKKRLYYRIYLISKYANSILNECIYEYLFRLFLMIDHKYGTKCLFALDTSFRDTCLSRFTSIMKNEFGIVIDESNKELYMPALLDRKYATPEEADKFAELEQFGDAVYELAVDNIFFYDPNSEDTLDHQLREQYINAESQIVVAKRIGFDKCYVSKLHDSMNQKYIDHEDIEAGLDFRQSSNFIADMLEMIIGAVAKDLGIQKALDFATSVILKAYPDLHQPEIIKNFDTVALCSSNIDRDYLDKIFPRPFLEDYDENEYWQEYSTIWYALSKLIKIGIIGNDTKEKRKMIAHDANRILTPDGITGYYDFVVSYLYYGIEETIRKFTPIVESNYSNYKE